MSKALETADARLRDLYKTRPDNMPLVRLIARIEAHKEEANELYDAARRMVRHLTGDEDF